MRHIAAIPVMGLFVLAACGASSGGGFYVSCESFASKADVAASTEVHVNDPLTVSLCSEPSAGVLRPSSVTIDDPSIIEQDGHDFELTAVYSSDGSPERLETWTFTAKAPGQTTISFHSSPSSGPVGAGDWTYRLVVFVVDYAPPVRVPRF